MSFYSRIINIIRYINILINHYLKEKENLNLAISVYGEIRNKTKGIVERYEAKTEKILYQNTRGE